MIWMNPILFLLFLPLAYGQCDWTPTNLPALITDLRTATDFTYTNYIYGISNCQAAPSTDILWVTAEVSGKLYPAADSQIEVHSIAPTIDALFPFPGLVMTNLHQGDVITLSWSQTLTPQSLIQTGVFQIAVAPYASTNSPTAPSTVQVTVIATNPANPSTPIFTQTTTFTSNGFVVTETQITTPGTALFGGSTTSAAATSTGKSTPVGAIVGGVIGGLALLGIIAGFVIVLSNRKRSTEGWQGTGPGVVGGGGGDGGGRYSQPPMPPADKYAQENQYASYGMEQTGREEYHGAPSQPLRYPDQIPSGAVQGNY